MARIQILELPEGSSDDRPPFLLVVDESVPQRYILGPDDNPVRDYWQDIAQQIGARGVIVTPETVDIPANDTTAYLDTAATPEASLKLDDHDVRGAIAADMNKAREQAGLPTLGQQLADERTDIARDTDRLAKWKNEITDALRIYRSSSWNDIRNTIEALRNERDDQAAKVEQILRLSETPQQGTGVETDDYLHGYRDAIRWALAALTVPVDDRTANAEESTGRPAHPDGTPYRYHEIKAEGWDHCDGCRTWGQWTAEKPHDCINMRVMSGDTARSHEEQS